MKEGDAPKEPNSERSENEICPSCRHLEGLLCLKTRILFKKGESFLSECNCFESLMESSIPHQSDSSKTDAVSVETSIVQFEELSPSEESERQRLEEIVERSFFEAGRALKRLRDGKLYRSTHSSFESYVRERFAMRQSRSYQLIDAASVFEHLASKVPQIVELLPTNEAQCRPLTKLCELPTFLLTQ